MARCRTTRSSSRCPSGKRPAPPYRGGLGETVPTDALLYRFYEVLQVYGAAMPALIEEEFGDGIMSAIDCSLDIGRQQDPKGDRVVVTLNGKFVPYKTF